MDYKDKAKSVADCLLSYRRDESGWKVCRKSVKACFQSCEHASYLCPTSPALPGNSFQLSCTENRSDMKCSSIQILNFRSRL
uniref:Uncharacterized protein n=1 Tax=Fundulus heteroclitus TaxID=8078 RepID=A0A3Q2QRT6_FUNHE